MNAPLIVAGSLAVLGAAIHGVGGEVLVVDMRECAESTCGLRHRDLMDRLHGLRGRPTTPGRRWR